MTIDSKTTGLTVSIYKTDRDCTNGGASSRATQALLIGRGVAGSFTVGDADRRGEPVFRLVCRDFRGASYLSAVPADAEGDGVGRYMFGGNFLYTSDSRFADVFRTFGVASSGYPIPIHDRKE